ncbi:MAG: glycoside hydrolase family 5 protein [Fimbriimonadaceae bacterium]|nr:glycoside hydrolase family 5 protein [Fimbriimonadaceae bacterium]
MAVLLAWTQAGAEEPLTANNYLQRLSPGINLGNTLEAIPTATSWGNPKPTFAYFQAVRKAGFKSVRIPVAWSQYADKNHRIGSEWMAHVTDVVRMANRAGLYALINVHWDGGWIQATYAKRDAVNAKLTAFWTQIATHFKDFDEKLLFAGTNEIGVEGVYGPPTPENAEVQNGFNQTFVDAVRATGGKNGSRWLVVQGYNTNIEDAVKYNATMPRDVVKGRLMMEVHYYSPYNFTLNDKSEIWQWGAKATDPKATETWANEAYADAQFRMMKEAFVDKGVPVLLGEYCAGLKARFPGMRPFQSDWNRHVTRSAFKHGLVPMYWDVGYASGLFNRTSGAPQDSEMIKIIVESAQ